MKKKILSLGIFLFLCCVWMSHALVVQAAETSQTETEETMNILFIGNSFTKYTEVSKGVGDFFSSIAESNGKKVNVTMVKHGGAHLSYYLNTNTYLSYYTSLMQTLSSQKFDYIVLQECSLGPVNLLKTEMVPTLRTFQSMLDALQPDAKVLLYMTHGYGENEIVYLNGVKQVFSEDDIQKYAQAGYMYAGEKTGYEVVPAGMYYRRARLLYPEVTMFTKDQKHPSYNGYFLIAGAFYQALYGEVPVNTVSSMNAYVDEDTQKKLYNSLVGNLSLNETYKLVLPGDSFDLTARMTGTQQEAIHWSSLNEKVATVQNGKVVTLAPGETAIIAESDSKLRAVCWVQVEDETLHTELLRFQRENCVGNIGERVKILPEYSDVVNPGDITWSSKNAVKVVISLDGTVTGLGAGRSKIEAKDSKSGKTASYYYFVRCGCVGGLAAKVQNNGITEPDKSDMSLSWQSVDSATKYNIYRANSKDGPYEKIGTSTTTGYVDKGILNNTIYYYKVTAIATYSQCESELDKSGVLTAIALGKINNFMVFENTNEYLSLSWDQDSGAQGYILYRSTSKSSGYKVIARIQGGSATTYKDTSVQEGKKYYYKIKATGVYSNHTYSSPASNVLSEKVDVLRVAPKSVSVKSVSDASKCTLKVSWSKVSNGYLYKVYRTNSQGTKTVLVGTTSDTFFMDSSVKKNNTYTYYVTACNAKGKCESSRSGKRIGAAVGKASLKSVKNTSAGVSLKWTRNSQADGYAVYRSKNGKTYKKIATISNKKASGYTDKTANGGTAYFYKITAYKKLKGKMFYSPYSKKMEIITK